MLAKDKIKSTVIRSLLSDIQNEEKQLNKKQDPIKLIKKALKQRQEAQQQYLQAHRPDLALNEEQEYQLIQSYLPKALTEEEVTLVIRQAMEQVEVKEMGKVTRKVFELLEGKNVERQQVSQKIKALLSE
jgi:uncharacterized protein YqeY